MDKLKACAKRTGAARMRAGRCDTPARAASHAFERTHTTSYDSMQMSIRRTHRVPAVLVASGGHTACIQQLEKVRGGGENHTYCFSSVTVWHQRQCELCLCLQSRRASSFVVCARFKMIGRHRHVVWQVWEDHAKPLFYWHSNEKLLPRRRHRPSVRERVWNQRILIRVSSVPTTRTLSVIS